MIRIKRKDKVWSKTIVCLIIFLLFVAVSTGITGTVLGIINTVRGNPPPKSSSDSPIYTLPPQAIMIDESTYTIAYPEHGVYGIAIVNRGYNDSYTREKRSHVQSAVNKVLHTQCTGNINPGTRWRTVEPYVVDPSNNQGLPSSFISQSAAAAVSTWQQYIAFKPIGNQIIGTLTGGTAFTGVNGLAFGAIDIPGASHAIAVTVLYWSCSAGMCSYVEWKQIYNTVNYQFGSAVTNQGHIIDLLNTNMHEFGHTLGNPDQYADICSEDTMYGIEAFRERKKITLEEDDIYNVRTVIGYGTADPSKTGDSSKNGASAAAYTLLVLFIIL